VPPLDNLITDLPGIRVGHAHDARVATGVTAIVFDTANVASCVTRGGGPGTRDTALLEPEMTVTSIDAVLLSGGSIFGLDAAGGGLKAGLRPLKTTQRRSCGNFHELLIGRIGPDLRPLIRDGPRLRRCRRGVRGPENLPGLPAW